MYKIVFVPILALILQTSGSQLQLRDEGLVFLAVAGNPESPNIDERLVVLKQDGRELRTILEISNYVWNQTHRLAIPPYVQAMLPTLTCHRSECLLIYNYNYLWDTSITRSATELLTHQAQIGPHILRIRGNVIENLTDQLLKTPTLSRHFGPGKCVACDYSLYSAVSNDQTWLVGGSLLIGITPLGLGQLHITNEKGESLIRESDGRLVERLQVLGWDGTSWTLGHPHRLLRLHDRQLSIAAEFPHTLGLAKDAASTGDHVLVAGWQSPGLAFTSQAPGLWSYQNGAWKNVTDALPKSYFEGYEVSGDYAYIVSGGRGWLVAYEAYFSRPRIAEYGAGLVKDYTNLLPSDFRLLPLFISLNKPVASDGSRWILVGSTVGKKDHERFRVLEIRDGVITDLNLKFPQEIREVLGIQLLSSRNVEQKSSLAQNPVTYIIAGAVVLALYMFWDRILGGVRRQVSRARSQSPPASQAQYP